jgi:hypothetical protein
MRTRSKVRALSSTTRSAALERLGCTEASSREAIRDAYYRLAKACHPDQGGSAADFRALAAAYETALRSDDAADTADTTPAHGFAADDPLAVYVRVERERAAAMRRELAEAATLASGGLDKGGMWWLAEQMAGEDPEEPEAAPRPPKQVGAAAADAAVEVKSRFWGVTWNRNEKKWVAYYVDVEGKRHTIGYFLDEETAARKRDEAVRAAGLEGKSTMNVDDAGLLVPKPVFRYFNRADDSVWVALRPGDVRMRLGVTAAEVEALGLTEDRAFVDLAQPDSFTFWGRPFAMVEGPGGMVQLESPIDGVRRRVQHFEVPCLLDGVGGSTPVHRRSSPRGTKP